MMGTPGHRSRTSGCLGREDELVDRLQCVDLQLMGAFDAYHLVVMFCRESVLETEKAMRMTWAWL